ncbi:Mannan polymerase I complex van1 subunit [Hanseniaspora valbyensis]
MRNKKNNKSTDSLPTYTSECDLDDDHKNSWKGKKKSSLKNRKTRRNIIIAVILFLLVSIFILIFSESSHVETIKNTELLSTINNLIKPLREKAGVQKISYNSDIGGLDNMNVEDFDIDSLIKDSKDKKGLYALGLKDIEYYNYDFRNLDVDTIHKFDKGIKHYLITHEADIYSSEENKAVLENELEMLLASNVEKYDLHDFKGDPDGVTNRDHVLLLVPLRNAEAVLPLMFRHLMNLTYPHELIDLGFLVSDCSPDDKTLETLLDYSLSLQNGTLISILENIPLYTESDMLHLKYMQKEYLEMVEKSFSPPFHLGYTKPFRSIQIFEKNFGQIIGQGFSDRHAVKVQGVRRKLMGRARNWLVSNTLKAYHSWVYWRDVDVELCLGSVIQDLMKFDYDIMVPNVWRPLPTFLGNEQPYDLNSWIESPAARQLAQTLDEDDVIVEGYAEYPTWRVHLANLRNPKGDLDDLVDLDGVGGVSILAKAKIFRSGINFPAYTFENHAETEAFGKMAKKTGYRVGGLPHYVLWHIYEPSEDDLKDMAVRERDDRRDLN